LQTAPGLLDDHIGTARGLLGDRILCKTASETASGTAFRPHRDRTNFPNDFHELLDLRLHIRARPDRDYKPVGFIEDGCKRTHALIPSPEERKNMMSGVRRVLRHAGTGYVPQGKTNDAPPPPLNHSKEEPKPEV